MLLGPFVRNPPASALQAWIFRTMMAPLWVASMWKFYLPTLYKGKKPADFAAYRATVIASLKRPGYGKAFSLTTRQPTHDPAEARLGDVTAPAIVIMGDSDPDFKDPAGEAAWIGEQLHARSSWCPRPATTRSPSSPRSPRPPCSASSPGWPPVPRAGLTRDSVVEDARR